MLAECWCSLICLLNENIFIILPRAQVIMRSSWVPPMLHHPRETGTQRHAAPDRKSYTPSRQRRSGCMHEKVTQRTPTKQIQRPRPDPRPCNEKYVYYLVGYRYHVPRAVVGRLGDRDLYDCKADAPCKRRSAIIRVQLGGMLKFLRRRCVTHRKASS